MSFVEEIDLPGKRRDLLSSLCSIVDGFAFNSGLEFTKLSDEFNNLGSSGVREDESIEFSRETDDGLWIRVSVSNSSAYGGFDINITSSNEDRSLTVSGGDSESAFSSLREVLGSLNIQQG